MHVTNIKEAAYRLVDQLPEDATWDDLMRKAYEQQAIEIGVADSEAGRVTEVEAVRRRYGLSE
jgi:predicted transcriptional regulator